jgi:hypothetical protein
MRASNEEAPAGQGGRIGEAADEEVVEMKATAPLALVPPPEEEPAFDASEVHRFLAWLGGPVALTSITTPADAKQHPHATKLFRPEQIEEAVEWARCENEARRNVYFTPNEVRPDFQGVKPGKKDITAARFAWADADPACSPEEPERYAAARARVREVAVPRAEEVGVSAAVWSGNGVQVFLKYDRPRTLDGQKKNGQPLPREQAIEILEGATKRFAHAFDPAADNVQNVDRLMRLPGTVNFAGKTKLDKGYPRRTQSRILSLTDRTWAFKEIEKTFPALQGEGTDKATGGTPTFSEDVTPLDEGEQAAVVERLARLRETDPFVRARWEGRGVGLGDGSRSGLDMSLGAMLKVREFTYREMRHALVLCPSGAGAKKAAEGDERYFQRIWTRSGFTAVSVQEVKDALCRLEFDADARGTPLSTEEWAKVVFDAHLDGTQREEILTFLSEEVGVGGKRAVNQAWKDYFEERSETYAAARSKDGLALASKGREEILWNPLDYNGMLPKIEEALVEDGLLRIDRAYVRVSKDVIPNSDHPDNAHRPEGEKLPPPQQVLFVPHSKVSMLLAVEKSVCLYRRGEKGTVFPIEVPFDKLPPLMLDLPEKSAPRVTGLVLHPVHTPSGRLVSTEGLDAATGLYLSFDGWKFPQVGAAPTKDEAKAAARRIREALFGEVLFKDVKVDGAAAVAALLTGISRKATDQGPAILINATVQGTGKTTLARMMHAVLTGRDMAVQTLPDDQGEARKQILATLMRSPTMVCFDNIPDGATIDNPVLSPVITSPVYTQRILGLTQDVDVPTCSLFVFTGNKVEVASDLIRRFVKIDLLAKDACPEQRRFKNADPIAYAQSIRVEVIHALLTIQRAWFAAGAKEAGPSLGLGNDIDRLVTWPLAFAGEEGIFEKRAEVAETSPEQKAKVAALVALAVVFGTSAAGGAVPADKEFTSTEAVRKMNGGSDFLPSNADEVALRDAIEATERKRVHSAPALGHFLGALVDQPLANLDLMLRSRTVRGRTLYHVEVGVAASGGDGGV